MIRPVTLSVAALVLAAGAVGAARQPVVHTQSLAADAAPGARLAALIEHGRLRMTRRHFDTMVPGRVHERLAQLHEGLPVFGSGVVRQIDGGFVRTAFGHVYEDIGIPTAPAVHVDDAARLATDAVGGKALVFEPVTLGVLPLADQYALAWRVPVRSRRSIEDVFVDAGTGVVLRRRSRIRTQLGDVGLGRGVFGDDKKVAARRTTGGFETHDGLRPGSIQTYDFQGSPSRLVAFFQTGLLNPGDLAHDSDNTWEDGAVVDAHVYQGLAYDYFFRRFARRGMDDADGPVRTVVHPLLRERYGLESEVAK